MPNPTQLVLRGRSVVALALSFAAVLAFSPLARAAGRRVMTGHVPAAVRSARPIERVPGTNVLTLAIGLPARNPAVLRGLIEDLYNPASPAYRRFLTPAQFAEQFGASEADYEAVLHFVRGNSLRVVATHPNRLLVEVEATVSDVEGAFQLTLRRYQHPRESRSFFAPETEPSVVAGVPILEVTGLDDYHRPRPAGLRVKPLAQAGSPAPLYGSGPGGAYMGYDFRAAYAPGVTLTGAGQTVGLLQFDGYYAADITAYETQAGLPNVPLQNVLLNGFSGNPGLNNAEVALDIEMVVSMAPGLSKVIVYEGTQGNTILSRIATDNLAKQISSSWTFTPVTQTTETLFQQLAVQGQSYFNASGDSCAYTGAVSTPADDPYVTVVGGTTLTTAGDDGAYFSETAWNWGWVDDGYFGSSGGVSLTYALPSWQQGLSMTANLGSTTKRNLPDVALTADDVWVIHSNGSVGRFGGTSCAAPLWAGFMALVNQQAASYGLPPIGFLNPPVYAIGKGTNYSSCFHDITTGNNFTSNSPAKYPAVAGYDLCTGWGTPNGRQFINALAPPPDGLVVLPTSGFAAGGPPGGPFSVTARSFTLTNTTPAFLSWSLVNTSSWLSASASSGTLAPESATAVDVSLTTAAADLPAGSSNSAVVTFHNWTTGVGQNRTFSLAVVPFVQNGGFEAGSTFASWTRTGVTNGTSVSTSSQYIHSGLRGARLGPSGALGYLSQTVTTVPGQSYLLSCWLSCPIAGTPNQFQVKWGTNTLFNQSNLGAFGWTNLLYLVTASGSNTVLQFGYRHDRFYFALDDISLTAVARPAVQPRPTGGPGLQLTWTGMAGLRYQLQAATNLVPAQWLNVGTPLRATNGTVSATDLIGPAPSRFYRLLLVP